MNTQAIKYRALNTWFTTPQGARVGMAIADELKKLASEINGEKLLQLGHCGENSWLSALHFPHKWIATPYVDLEKVSLVSSLKALPIIRDSLDCVIAPLTLEAFLPGSHPLDEIDRVLKPMGHVFFIGINPLSFWGAALKWGYLSCLGHEQATLTSSFSLKRMMFNRGYIQRANSSFYYIPPFNNEKLIKRGEFFNEMGKMLWPFPAGFYCLIMQKYQPSATLVQEVSENNLALTRKSSLAVGNCIHK